MRPVGASEGYYGDRRLRPAGVKPVDLESFSVDARSYRIVWGGVRVAARTGVTTQSAITAPLLPRVSEVRVRNNCG